MRRRQFLANQGAALVAGMIPSLGNNSFAAETLEETADIPVEKVTPDAATVPHDLDIIDCHTHFYDPSRPEGVPWPEKGTPLYRTVLPQHLRELPQFRPVTGTVVVEASPWVEDNSWLLDLAKEDPFIVGIVGNLSPESPEFPDLLRRFAKNRLFRGIRISSKILTRLLEGDLAPLKLMADLDLSLDVNGGPETPGIVAQAAKRLTSLRFILNHIGNVEITSAAPPEAWTTGIRAAGTEKQVYCKVSALVEGAARKGNQPPTDLDFYRPYIDVVWNAFGDNRVIYGSNWPVSEKAADYVTLQRIVLEYAASREANAIKKFCSLNAQQAYKWIERKGRVVTSPREKSE
ncbi:MAG: amidohydrolase family protein [Planctomycetaceae bacterium]